MNSEKIAVICDSCSDVPREYAEKLNILIIPQTIKYKDREYLDGVDITSREVCERLSKEIPKTSLPSAEVISDALSKAKAMGCTGAIITTISAGLSGTNNFIKLIAGEFDGLDCRVIDTKSIGIGAGFFAITAAELAAVGLSLDRIAGILEANIAYSKIFFCVDTLEYLRKGGRIGLISAIVGTTLGLKPIISCNESGVYYTVSKQRGRVRALGEVSRLAVDFAGDSTKVRLAVVQAGAADEAKRLLTELKSAVNSEPEIICGSIGPALTAHTGSGLIGVGVQRLDFIPR